MFEKEIKFIVDFSLNKMKNLGSFFSFEKLLTTDIHPAILHYISAEIDFLIFEDRKKLIQNSVFDYSGPEIAKYFNLIGEEVKKTRKISVEDIKKLITQAVSFNVNFVARPKWSLSKLIFNDSDLKPIEEIRLSLNYVYYYEYLKNILLSYLNKKKSVSLTLIEFEVLLNKIDKELFSVQSNKLVDNILYSIADFMNIGSSSNKVPVQSVEVFFKERNLIEYLFKLRRALPIDSKQKYSVEELCSIIYSTMPLGKQVLGSVEPEDSEIPTEDFSDLSVEEDLTKQEVQKEEELPVSLFEKSTEELLKELNEPFDFISDENSDVEENVDEEIIISSSKEDDLLKLYDDELKSLEELEEEIKEDNEEIELDISHKEILNEFYDFGNDPDDELLDVDEISADSEDEGPLPNKKDTGNLDNTTEEKSGIEKVQESHFRERNNFPNDLLTYLKDKEIDKIVNSVFDDDREDFAISMDRISECSSYDEATEILKSVFLTYRVNPYSRDAVSLTNAVANYFNQA
jgi:hypothetical protein